MFVSVSSTTAITIAKGQPQNSIPLTFHIIDSLSQDNLDPTWSVLVIFTVFNKTKMNCAHCKASVLGVYGHSGWMAFVGDSLHKTSVVEHLKTGA